MLNETALSYRRSAIEGASPIGLVIALYDTLWGDLGRACAAIRNNDIELRCRELNHATLVLGQLEDWVDIANGGDLAKSLAGFYSFVRAKIMQAGIAKSAPLLEAQMKLILHVRSAWQERDSFPAPPAAIPAQVQDSDESKRVVPSSKRLAFSQNA
jgi:flagellar biosynthetic protein FliS